LNSSVSGICCEFHENPDFFLPILKFNFVLLLIRFMNKLKKKNITYFAFKSFSSRCSPSFDLGR